MADEFIKDFHVITMVSNTVRFSSRYRLYHEFRARMEAQGVRLWTAEIAFGTRPFELTEANDPYDLQMRSLDEIWHKERALNLLVNRITEQHPGWKYVAWIDADVEFQNDNWLRETVHMLQHYDVVQMFQNAIDLGPSGEALHMHTGLFYMYRMGMPFKPGYLNGHPGFAWACTREAYHNMGGFIDFAILGSGDRHMALGWIGKIEESVNMNISEPYLRKLFDWQNQCERYIRRDVGYVNGTIMHHWHGRKKDRRYQDRWKILTDLHFDPDRDIKLDSYGLYQLADHGDRRSIELRDRVRDYFHGRNEDSIDVE